MKRTYPPPEIVTKMCTGCGLCAEVCPSFVLDMVGTKALVVRGEWCIGCGHCGAVCPVEAVVHETIADERAPRPGRRPATTADTLLMLLRERRSVRLYRNEPISDEILEQIIEAGRYAPTGSNSQNVHYVILRSSSEITSLRNMTMAFYEKVFSRVRKPIGALLLSLLAGRRIVEYLRELLPKVEYVKGLIEEGKDPLFYNAPVVMVVHAESWDTCSAFNCAVAIYNLSLIHI